MPPINSPQIIYPCLCNPCDFQQHLTAIISLRRLWFDIALPRYAFLIALGEATVRPQTGDGRVPQTRWEYAWVEPVLEDARRLREELRRLLEREVSLAMGLFGDRWGVVEEERLRRGVLSSGDGRGGG